MNADDRRRLRAALRSGSSADALIQAFAIIRETEDADLLAALMTPAPAARHDPSLAHEIRTLLDPILANARDKAEALRRSALPGGGDPIKARGLADMVRALEQRIGADAVRSAAQSLLDDARRLGGRADPIP